MRHLVPVLLLAAAAGSAQAADNNTDRIIGFEFGVGYHLADDQRYEGNSVSLALVIPINATFDALVYHENGRFYGKQDAAKSNIDTNLNELRVRINAWNGKMGGNTASLGAFLGLGFSDYKEREGAGPDWAGAIADVGVELTPLRTQAGPVRADLNIVLSYRYAHFSEQTAAGGLALADPLSKLGGFIIGLSAGLSF